MGDFMKKYLPIYIMWLLFISFVAVSLQIESQMISVNIPSGADFTVSYVQNTMRLIIDIVSFQIEGIPALIITACFFLPSIPVLIWVIELVIDILDVIIPF